jgi:hypothetical protein
MRFLLPDHLGNDKHSMMFHTSGFAIAAGVVAVGAAAGSAAISMSAADRAKKAQGAAAGQFKKQQRKATKELVKGQEQVQGMIADVQAPEYNLGAMIGDAGQISDYYRKQLETFQPGAAQQRGQAQAQIGQAMDVISQYLRGEVPQDVKEQIMRNVAESAGAGFNPATAGQVGGFQAAQGQMARNLGLTSLDIQRQGMAAIPSIQGTAQNWQQLARAFTAEPLDVGRLQLGYQTAGAEVGLQKAKMTSDMFSNIYNAQSGLASQIYGANKENIASSYAAQQAVGQGVSDIGQATSGALSGYSSALGKMGSMQGGGMGGAGTGPRATPLYNQQYTFATRGDQYGQVAGGRVYQGGNVATASMSDRPFAIPNAYTGK